MSKIRRFVRTAPDLVSALQVDGGTDERRGLGYVASEMLEHAINTSLALGRPLLVSGEPGCGKTELGFAIARKLGVDRVRFFSVKSDSEAQRLFYEYDAVRRFHAAQIASRIDHGDASHLDPRHFIRYQALGRAILDASPATTVEHLTSPHDPLPARPTQSVVIIDEIDKAPRDFPNDLLNELDQLWFRVPELAGWLKEPNLPETPRGVITADVRPIIVITSNLERQLPDAFLRRCVFHHIEHPEDELLQRTIVQNHLEKYATAYADAELGEAIAFVAWARGQNMDKPPGLAELIEFSRSLSLRSAQFPNESFLSRAAACIGALGKTTRDQKLLLGKLDAAART